MQETPARAFFRTLMFGPCASEEGGGRRYDRCLLWTMMNPLRFFLDDPSQLRCRRSFVPRVVSQCFFSAFVISYCSLVTMI